jgi:heterodisulfide reductase subunit B
MVTKRIRETVTSRVADPTCTQPVRLRMKRLAGTVKADQIKATGAKIVITPCHNCYDQINDLNEEYDLGVKVLSLKEALCEQMVIPDEFKPEPEEKDEG